MPVSFNHTIVHSVDKHASAQWFARVMGLGEPFACGHFQAVELEPGVTFDFVTADREVHGQHYAFLVSEADFDAIYRRIKEDGIEHWADPRHELPGRTNRHFGGRGVYFQDPSGHYLEIITKPYERLES